MNRKEIKELTGEDTKDMGIDCRKYKGGKKMNCPLGNCSAKDYGLTGDDELRSMQYHLVKDHRKFYKLPELERIREKQKEVK